MIKYQSDIIADSLTGNYLSLVTDYVQPMLIHYAMVDYLPFAAYQVKNGGYLNTHQKMLKVHQKMKLIF